MKFHTTLELAGKTATGVEVPPEVVSALGQSRKPAVRVTINGYTYRSTVATMGGRFMLPVSAEVRASAGIAAGEEVEVNIELDTEPREVTAPPDFMEALNNDEGAKSAFEKLSYSNKRRHILDIEGAKTAETRQRRIEKAITTLHGAKS